VVPRGAPATLAGAWADQVPKDTRAAPLVTTPVFSTLGAAGFKGIVDI